MPDYEIRMEEYDKQLRKVGFPKMLVRYSTPNAEEAITTFSHVVKEHPHLHVTLEYTPEKEA